jgi:hypothetical protein
MAIEDLTTYTEVDPNSKITVTAPKSAWAALPRNADAYVYKDKGAAHFGGNFEHLIDINVSSAQQDGFVVCWTLANLVNDWKGIDDAGGDLLSVAPYSSSTTQIAIYLYEMVAGTFYYDATAALANGTYYLKIKRDESVGTYGTLYCYIYSNTARTTLLDTLVLTLHEKEDFRYLYATQSYNDNTTYQQTGYSQNLDLQEGGQEYTRSYTALLGLLPIKSRTLGLSRSKTGLLGLLPAKSRVITLTRQPSTPVTEEQTQYNSILGLNGAEDTRGGQRLTVSNRTITGLGFWLRKEGGSPTGNITFSIRKVSDDSVIVSKIWGNASAVPGDYTYEEVTFDSPVAINEEVRLCCEFSGGDESNWIGVALQLTDVKSNEYACRWWSTWYSFTGYDFAYIYTYKVGVIRLGLAVTASKVKGYVRTKTALLGLLPAKSRVLTLTRSKTGLLGLLPAKSRVISATRSKTVLLGLKATATRVATIVRLKTGLLGLKPIANRTLTLTRSKVSLLGLKVTAAYSTANEFIITAYLGLKATATRSISLSRSKTALLGLKPLSTKIINLTRSKTALLGLKVTSTRTLNSIRSFTALLGLKGSATRSLVLSRTKTALLGLKVIAIWGGIGRQLVIKVLTSQYRLVRIATSQHRIIKVLTSQYRKIKVFILGD